MTIEIAIVGAACRLPGAADLEQFWELLVAGHNTVRPAPQGRWSVERFLRPGKPTPGFAYSFAGGYLDAPLAFDPAPFGISPREVQQMDPQQRILLEVVWQALEDAGMPPSDLAGRNVGVYIGASTVDYQNGASYDPAVMGSHFMTGNSLALVSNRISYIYNFCGPSFTLDSACSSSFVAVDRAVAALRAGEIEMAVVGGVNMLLSPAPFVGFSQAHMLSPTGLSRPFSNDADGYVRSEGAVVLVLKRKDAAEAAGDRQRALIVDVAVNSDGRTNGISLPSLEGQRRLLDGVYDKAGLSVDEIAFVEAHGTGTRVGDPIEATAIGQSIGQKRSKPLPIGSVKSNIGHLEAASGLAGLLKSALALENRLLPKSLFLDRPSDAIPFGDLGLAPNAENRTLDLARDGRFAAICNYGFGGTNAHVLIRAPHDGRAISETAAADTPVLLLSAASKTALAEMAGRHAQVIEGGVSAPVVAAHTAHFRELQKFRLALPAGKSPDVVEALKRFAQDGEAGGLCVSGEAGSEVPLVFVFSGNGAQFPEMGQAAYAESEVFRREIAAIDRSFKRLAGWSIADKLGAPIAAEELAQTTIAQPLIFAIQSAMAGVLRHYGFHPESVIGHSVGEVAAAEAAGILTRESAVRLIYHRSQHQEKSRGLGRMIVAAAPRARVEALLESFGNPAIEIAANNSPTSVSLAGPADALASFAKQCRLARIAVVPLDIDYPFHSSALDPLKEGMVADLSAIRPNKGSVRFFSTVTGGELSGETLDATYWWRNIRDEVRFAEAVAAVADRHKLFVEIAPRAILTAAITENLRSGEAEGEAVSTFSQKDVEHPVALSLSRLMVRGAAFELPRLFGARPAWRQKLPHYPTQDSSYNLPGTSEAFNVYGRAMSSELRHPLLGARLADGSPEWRTLLDAGLVPYLHDHRVDGSLVVPAAALIEMALAAGRDLFGAVALEIGEFDILRPLAIADDETREISVRYAAATASLEIWSRKRFAVGEWIQHARASIAVLSIPPVPALPSPDEAALIYDSAADVYAEASRAGLEYGPLFQLVASSRRDHYTADAQLSEPRGGLGAFSEHHVLHPASLDAAFHGLFVSRPQKEGERKAHLPVRFRKIRVWRQGVPIRRAITFLTNETDRFKTVTITLLDAEGAVVAAVEAAVLQALVLSRATFADRTFRTETFPLSLKPGEAEHLSGRLAVEASSAVASPEPAWLVMRAFAISLAHRLLGQVTGDGRVDLGSIRELGLQPPAELLLRAAIRVVEGFGLVDGGILKAEHGLPAPEALLKTLFTRFPAASFDLRLAAHALVAIDDVVAKAQVLAPPVWLREQFESGEMFAAGALAALREEIEATATGLSRPLRVLAAQLDDHGLIRTLEPLVARGVIELTLCAPDRKSATQARAMGRVAEGVEVLSLDSEADQVPAVPYDVVVAVCTEALRRDGLPGVAALLHAGSLLVLAQPGVDVTLDFLCGIWNGWLGSATRTDTALERRAGGDAPRDIAERFGARNIVSRALADGLGSLCVARMPNEPGQSVAEFAVIGQSGYPLFDRLAAAAVSSIQAGTGLKERLDAAAAASRLPEHLVYVPHAVEVESTEALAATIEAVKAIAVALEGYRAPVRVTVLTRGAGDSANPASPNASGIWGFMRVAINEFPNIDFRLLDCASDLDDATCCARVAEACGLRNGELELLADTDGLSALRVRRGLNLPRPLAESERAELRFEKMGRLDSFQWLVAPRSAVAAGEIEVEVQATGLNFRDILVGLGILDEDLLGAGLTAGALGFECAGIVSRIGGDVAGLAVGDRVMGFAKNTFASHVVAPAWHFFKVPESMSIAAAATIPVAFATAWFALINRGQIRPGEKVLVHGGAGAVGLAAIQIAKSRGAVVLATASSEERRAIARAAGADHCYDSRHERFVEPILHDHGGVDVVLNSLAGSAMAASFRLVKPFGRFIELGKRDYLDNTRLGLRPFIRNISYFGVDLDELLGHDRGLVEEIMREIAVAMQNGDLSPLPHRVYPADDLAAAFGAMQASQHVGKIVVSPAREALPDITTLRMRVKQGVYLVVGGTGGLGLQTALWLARHGASTLVLASRRGKVEDAGKAAVAAIRALGVTVSVEALDVTDQRAVSHLVARTVRAYGAVRGVVHAAVQLDDGMISGLDPERLRTVLATKIDGARNLAIATQDQPLDLFVLYSSATTVIGSPGQGAYVAANAWLEGFARQLREQGRKALAIGWGAISDVGIIARDQQLGSRLQRTTGVVGISSAESLAHLGRILALGETVQAAQFYTNISPTAAAGKLRLLKSPTFAGLGLAMAEDIGAGGGDLIEEIQQLDRDAAVDLITAALRREVSYILRTPEEQIDARLPLGELGLDSLMALELQLAIERLCGMELPMFGSADRRIADLAGSLYAKLGGHGSEAEGEFGLTQSMAAMHGVNSDDIAVLPAGDIDAADAVQRIE
jgi:phthiocerol/phenolphthiocerol synthesis type-I polyketide synthase C